MTLAIYSTVILFARILLIPITCSQHGVAADFKSSVLRHPMPAES